MNSRIIRRCLLTAVLAGGAWWFASAYFRKNWSWPLSLLFGAVAVLVIVYGGRRAAGKPAPFQLVLRLADDKGGDQEDDRTFKTLHARFKQQFPKSGSIRFDGFDTDGSFIWFYFFGPEEDAVRHAVLPGLEGCRIRQGSYFLSKATQPCAAPNDGPATLLGDSRIIEGPSSVS
jgi:hypothetical protein